MVRVHLEGNDHTVHFPNYTTGKFENVQPGVLYTIYGHPYVADEIWKGEIFFSNVILYLTFKIFLARTIIPNRSLKQEMVKVPTEGEIYSGKLKLVSFQTNKNKFF